MPHAKFLRALGQCLETLHVDSFQVEKSGDTYNVRGDELTPEVRSKLRRGMVSRMWASLESAGPQSQPDQDKDGVAYRALDLSWIDSRGRRRRRADAKARIWAATKPSQLLRTVGNFLDRVEASDFRITVAAQELILEYVRPGAPPEQRRFGVDELRQLGLHMKFRRSRRSG